MYGRCSRENRCGKGVLADGVIGTLWLRANEHIVQKEFGFLVLRTYGDPVARDASRDCVGSLPGKVSRP